MSRTQETFQKKDVRDKKEKKRKEKAARRLAKKDKSKSGSLDDMIAYVDEFGNITGVPPELQKKSVTDVEAIEISTPKASSVDAGPVVQTGVVTYFNDKKGFGFIKDSTSRDSVFVHIADVTGEIDKDVKVSYELSKGPRGLSARNVTVLK